MNAKQHSFQEKRKRKKPVQVVCLKKCSRRLLQRIEADTLKDTQGEVEAEARLYAVANALGEIKTEIILRESA